MNLKTSKKILSIVLTFLILFKSVSPAVIVFAQETVVESPTPTPTEEPLVTSTENNLEVETEESQPTETPVSNEEVDQSVDNLEVENNAEVNDQILVDSNSGNNEVLIATPSPTPLPSTPPELLTSVTEPTSTPEPSNQSSTSDQTTENVQSLLQTPIPTEITEETVLTESDTTETTITTGDSTSVTNIENNINTNYLNSIFVNQTLNIFVPNSLVDIDLSKLAENAVSKIQSTGFSDGGLNLVATSIDNFAIVENNIEQFVNTGNNTIDSGEGLSNITTGDAYSVVTVLNNVNTNIINSKIYLITINIFTDFEGDIILPELDAGDGVGCCANDLEIENKVSLTNNIASLSNTGDNTVQSNEAGEINTGNSESVVNVVNLVNTNYVNVVFKNLTIQTFGTWLGDFLGWGDIDQNTSDNIEIHKNYSQSTVNDNGCIYCSNPLDLKNYASVSNNIVSDANTGGNNVSGSRTGQITTGDSYSAVSVFNLINSNFVNSTGFIGFINIFGNLIGDIGGVEAFEEKDEDDNDNQNEKETENNNQNEVGSSLESGGQLEVTGKNNVGEYVFPGDVVTFEVKVKNSGTGKIYNTIVTIEILKSNILVGQVQYSLNEIGANKNKTLTTGLKLSELAQPGMYETKIRVEAVTGSFDNKISKEVNDSFLIYSKFANISSVNSGDFEVVASNNQDVLGLDTQSNNLSLEEKMIIVFLSLLLLLLILKALQNRDKLAHFILVSYSKKTES